MQTLTLKVEDNYLDTIFSFLQSLPQGSVKIETKKEKEKKALKKEILSALDDIKYGRVYERV